jgi:hypothetical protein
MTSAPSTALIEAKAVLVSSTQDDAGCEDAGSPPSIMTRSDDPRMGLISLASKASLATRSRSIRVAKSGVCVVPAEPPKLQRA